MNEFQVSWAELSPVNILFAITTLATFGTSLLAYLQSRHNSKTLAVNKDLTEKVAKSVNGHLDGMTAEMSQLRNENSALKDKARD